MFSRRVKNIKESSICKYNEYVSKREKKGIMFYRANIGQPNFNTDKSYYEALSQFNMSINCYTSSRGILPLRSSVANYYNRILNLRKYNEEDVVVTQGASDALIKLLYSICDVNDDVILLEPFFSDYKIYCDMLELNIVPIDYTNISYESLSNVITSKTKAILLANPNNPDGKIMSCRKINELIKFAKKYNLFVIADEVYSGLIYTDDFISLSQFNYSNLVVVDSASKKLNSCGSRIGFIISKNHEILDKICILNDSKISISNAEQYAITKLFENIEEIIKKSKEIYKSRLKKIINLIKETEINYIIPLGGISILLELPIDDCEKYVHWVVNQYEYDNKSFLVTPAKDFFIGDSGNNKIRLSLTINDKEIDEVIYMLIDSCNQYRRRYMK